MAKIITREEIITVLTQDAYYRKLMSWPLLNGKKLLKKNKEIKVEDCFSLLHPYTESKRVAMNKFKIDLNKKHPFIDELLLKFKDHLVACGGAICKSIIGWQYSMKEDIDLFFYNLSVEEADRLRIEVIEFLITEHKGNKIYITRNEFVTTIHIHGERKYKYQLIHRIYPNIAAILGGFDIGACMVAYDGEKLYTTPLGSWSIKNRAIIVDLKRRSTSFEYRLRKYFHYGFTIIFPGLLAETVKTLILDPCNKGVELLAKLNQLIEEYDYRFNGDLNKYLRKRGKENDPIYRDMQIQHNILPFLYLTDGNNRYRQNNETCYFSNNEIFITTVPYNREQIEDRYIKKISDYDHGDFHPKRLPYINATRLRLGNLSAVTSIIEVNDKFHQQLIDDINDPDLKFGEDMIEHSRLIAEREGFYDLSRVFGKLTPEFINSGYQNFDKYCEQMINDTKENYQICYNNLVGIKWLTQDPGRQWTASINPIIEDPRTWYGKHYIPVVTGILEEISITLQLARLRSIWTCLPDDIFNYIMMIILKDYADQAWQYI